MKKWNINVVEVKEAKNSGQKPFKADIDDIIRNYESISKLLEVADAAKIDFKKLKKDFDVLYKQLTAVDSKLDRKLLKSKVKKDAASILKEIYDLWKTKFADWEKTVGDNSQKEDIKKSCKLSENLLNAFATDRKKQEFVNKIEKKIKQYDQMKEELKKAFNKYNLSEKWLKILENYDSFSEDDIEELCKELEKKVIRKARGIK